MKPRDPKKFPVRKGQKKPYRRATKNEVDERIQEVVTMLGNGCSATDVRRAFRALNAAAKSKQDATEFERAKFDLDWRTIDVYISRAREVMLKNQGKTKDIVRGEAVAFYESVLKSDADKRTKIAARQRLDEIYGIDAPKHTHISTPEGGKIELEHKVKKDFDHDGYRKLCVGVFGIPDSNGDGQPVHPASADAASSLVPSGNRN